MQLSAQAFGSPQLAEQLSRLDANLQAARPGEDWGGSERFEGEQGMGLGDGTGALQDLAELDELFNQLSQSYANRGMDGSALSLIDLDMLARQLGDAEAVDARTSAELEKAVRAPGSMKQEPTGNSRHSPTPMQHL